MIERAFSWTYVKEETYQMRRYPDPPGRSQRGITGLETAIILIAFVVVASVFAFTVLSTGVFSSQRSKDTVYSGIQEAQSSLEPKGSVIAYRGNRGGTNTVYKFTFVLANALSGEPVDLTPPYTANDTGVDPDVSSGAEYVTVISYADKYQYLPNVPWSLTWLGNSDGDNLLEENEKVEITLWLLDRDTDYAVTAASGTVYMDGTGDGGGDGGFTSSNTLLTADDDVSIEIKPPSGAVLKLERSLPANLDAVMDLN